jgi:predicted nuclease of predicted toxin-antitoxin system
MRFLVDESTGRAIARWLDAAGHDTVYVGEQIPQADDDQVIELARTEARVLITNDKDFGEKVFRGSRGHAGILLLRLADERGPNKIQVVRTVVELFGPRLAGNFVVATEHGIRIRKPSE